MDKQVANKSKWNGRTRLIYKGTGHLTYCEDYIWTQIQISEWPSKQHNSKTTKYNSSKYMTHNTTVLYSLTCLECTKSYTGHQTDHWKISNERYNVYMYIIHINSMHYSMHSLNNQHWYGKQKRHKQISQK